MQGYPRAIGFLESIGFDRRRQAALAILVLWLVSALPSLSTRSFIWEEGLNAEIARGVLERGEFLVPHIYGRRWVEKPTLLPWLIAGTAEITGQVNEWSARLPSMLAALLVTLLSYRLGLRYLSLFAAFFAALALLYSPLVLQKLTIAEPDVIVTLLSFGAFLLWWNGAEGGRVSMLRWLGCGLLLAILTMAKGPQPAAFFVLGAGGYILVRRQWREIAGFALCCAIPAAATILWAVAVYRPGDEQTWRGYMRLTEMPGFMDYLFGQLRFLATSLIELLPATILLPFLPWRRLRAGDGKGVAPFALALALYAIPTSLILVLWPGSLSRYIMPAAPALALLAGFAWDEARGRLRSMARRVAAGTTAALLSYQLGLVCIAMPLYAERFGNNRTLGQHITATIAANPAPAFCIGRATNQIFYMRWPVRWLDAAGIRRLTAPAWLVVKDWELAEFSKLRPDLKTTIKLKTSDHGLLAVYVEP